ncbi:activator of osmoprotectant transporter ProP [Slackia heliotrinireducens DSM 20476]|uniref:Activator of osmoprotectant transporter ProP n=1 Tax=Slackia heliotrinireducens (strain ATCC 29202 / DSM 20476 / NCTC 11029 / RHS 1) TaxID=471855 RepID=C7N3P9_SLAHD|nr:activator of osmoprotectant transporter ProP [Slackia heliotrinireducens DSM 20476]
MGTNRFCLQCGYSYDDGTMPMGTNTGYVDPPMPSPEGPKRSTIIAVAAAAVILIAAIAAVVMFVIAPDDSGSKNDDADKTKTETVKNKDDEEKAAEEEDAAKAEAEAEAEEKAKAEEEAAVEAEAAAAPEPEPAPEPEIQAQTPPVFTDLSESSELPGDSVTSYYGKNNTIDDNPSTAWNEGADGDGSGEWLEFSASSPQLVSSIDIVGGYPKSDEVYYNNNRPRDITITFSDGTSVSTTLSDTMGAWQTITLSQPVATTSVRITIDSVYTGSMYNDCSFAEIKFY